MLMNNSILYEEIQVNLNIAKFSLRNVQSFNSHELLHKLEMFCVASRKFLIHVVLWNLVT